jgi:hypothetical protein
MFENISLCVLSDSVARLCLIYPLCLVKSPFFGMCGKIILQYYLVLHMQLEEIDKTSYRRHLNVVFAGIAVALMVLTLGISTLYIQLLGNPGESHFFHNLAGLVTAAGIVVYVLNKLRSHPYMIEVVYVWDLKQQLNRIHRKQRKIDAAVEKNDHDAMIILNFQYRGSKQLYELDDNTITMQDLLGKIRHLEKRMESAGLSLSTDSYEPSMLDRF